MNRLTFILLHLLTAAVFIGCGRQGKPAGESTNDFIPVKMTELKKEMVNRNIVTSGQFTTEDEVILSFKTGGIVKYIYVREGDKIKKGQLLAVLDLTEINAGVAQAKAGYEKALRDYERAKNLHKDSVATLAQFQDAGTALNLAQRQLETAKFNLSFSEIRAAGDGYVLKRFINEGQMTAPGTPVLQTNGSAKGNWVLRVSASDNEWASVRINDQAEITTDARGGASYPAVVLRKSEGVDPISGTFTIDLKLKAQADDLIASGLFGRAVITPREKTSVWVVPYESVLDGDGNTGFVFVSDDGKKARKVKVNIGTLNKENVWIYNGLENYKFLIVSGTAYLTDNSSIISKN